MRGFSGVHSIGAHSFGVGPGWKADKSVRKAPL